nr:MAG TPA: hypothetical protein [Caudoviricetes sp.]
MSRSSLSLDRESGGATSPPASGAPSSHSSRAGSERRPSTLTTLLTALLEHPRFLAIFTTLSCGNLARTYLRSISVGGPFAAMLGDLPCTSPVGSSEIRPYARGPANLCGGGDTPTPGAWATRAASALSGGAASPRRQASRCLFIGCICDEQHRRGRSRTASRRGTPAPALRPRSSKGRLWAASRRWAGRICGTACPRLSASRAACASRCHSSALGLAWMEDMGRTSPVASPGLRAMPHRGHMPRGWCQTPRPAHERGPGHPGPQSRIMVPLSHENDWHALIGTDTEMAPGGEPGAEDAPDGNRPIRLYYAPTSSLAGLPAFGASALRALTESRDTIRFVPSLHESRRPADISCETLAGLTPRYLAASDAVMAGMSDSSRETATAMTFPPCSGACPKLIGGISSPSMRWSSTTPESQSAALSTASSRSSPNVPSLSKVRGTAMTDLPER